MRNVLTRIPHVLIVQETSMKSGRDKLAGVFRYTHLYGPWHLHVVQGRIGEKRPVFPKDWALYDGFILGQMAAGFLAELRPDGKPVVLSDPLAESLSSSPFTQASCTQDHSEQVGRTGADYFMKRGWRSFAYVGEQLNRDWSILRGKGFRDRIAEAGFACRVYTASLADGDWNLEEQRLARWLAALPKPSAVLAAMDPRAQQVINLCLDIGIRIPDELAVMGIDDDELICNGTVPTLSSIRRDTEACGFHAAQMLDRLMRKKTARRESFVYGATGITERESTRVSQRIADSVALCAREFIRINAAAAIGVPDIVRHLHISRRQAEARFRAAFRHSLLDEIHAVRMAHVEKILRETDIPIKDVCSHCGQQTLTHIRRFFKARHGMTMQEYRRMCRTQSRRFPS